jgi:dihydrofolate reductase
VTTAGSEADAAMAIASTTKGRPMRKLITWNVMSLDARFEDGPWTLDFMSTVWGEELEAFSHEQLDEVGTLLFGRRTYEGMADHWQRQTDAMADRMNAVEKAVATRSLDTASWRNTTVLKGEAAETVADLKRQPGKDVYVFGSGSLCRELMAAGLVDEMRLCLAPLVLGRGTPLFDQEAQTGFDLLEARPLSNGSVILRYGRQGKGQVGRERAS